MQGALQTDPASLPPNLSFPGLKTFLWTLWGPGSAPWPGGSLNFWVWGVCSWAQGHRWGPRRFAVRLCWEDGAQETEGQGSGAGARGPRVPGTASWEDCWRVGCPCLVTPRPGPARHWGGPLCDGGRAREAQSPWRAGLSWAGKVQAPTSGLAAQGVQTSRMGTVWGLLTWEEGDCGWAAASGSVSDDSRDICSGENTAL